MGLPIPSRFPRFPLFLTAFVIPCKCRFVLMFQVAIAKADVAPLLFFLRKAGCGRRAASFSSAKLAADVAPLLFFLRKGGGTYGPSCSFPLSKISPFPHRPS